MFSTLAQGRAAREWILVGVALAGFGLIYAWVSHFGFDLLEEGYFLSLAQRVQSGELPYRDFSTPYTPAVFYVYAAVLDLAGRDVTYLRWLHIAVELVLLLALYLSARTLLPVFVAVLPLALTVLMGSPPELWSLHPGWYSAAAAMVGVLAVARYVLTRRAWLLLVAGGAFAIAFAFKQNLGLFGLMATVWFLVVGERELQDEVPDESLNDRRAPLIIVLASVRQMLQALALLALPLSGFFLMRRSFTLSFLGILIPPLVGLAVVAATRFVFGGANRNSRGLRRELNFYARPAVFMLGFGALTVPWLIALVVALKGHFELLGGFVGAVDLTAYFLSIPLADPLAYAAMLAAVIAPWLVVALTRSWADKPRLLPLLTVTCVVGGLATLLGSLLGTGGLSTPHAQWAAAAPAWSWYAGTGTRGASTALLMLLPLLAVWGSLARFTRDSVLNPALTSGRRLVRFWLLTAGAVFLLHIYPRMDSLHMVWNAGPLLILGADLLYAAYRRSVQRGGVFEASAAARFALASSLVMIPLVAALPELRDRLEGGPEFITRVVDRTANTQALLTEPGAGAPVWAPTNQVSALQEVVHLLQERTVVGEPVFAYPAIPGIYYLANRPNPTAFAHLLTGMATPDDQLVMVHQLDAVRYIVWDAAGVDLWTPPPGNPVVVDYVSAHFHLERTMGLYSVFVRNNT